MGPSRGPAPLVGGVDRGGSRGRGFGRVPAAAPLCFGAAPVLLARCLVAAAGAGPRVLRTGNGAAMMACRGSVAADTCARRLVLAIRGAACGLIASTLNWFGPAMAAGRARQQERQVRCAGQQTELLGRDAFNFKHVSINIFISLNILNSRGRIKYKQMSASNYGGGQI